MNEENDNRKIPNTAFSVLLFLFFYMLIRMFFRDVPLRIATWRDVVLSEDETVIEILLPTILYIVWMLLSLWSIVRLLKGKPDCVVCLRWALVFGLFMALGRVGKALGKALTIHVSYVIPSALLLLFIVVFLVYLARSGAVKRIYPVSDRRFSPGGWIWVTYLAIWIALYSVSLVQITKKNRNTQKIPVAELALPENSHCDGRILFESLLEWEVSDEELVGYDGEPYSVSRHRHESDSIILSVWCGVSEKARHSDYMSVLLQAIPFDISWPVEEGVISDTVIDEDQCYIEQYKCETDSVSFTWSFSVRFDSRSNKYCALSLLTKRSSLDSDFENSVRFLKSVVFDLTPYIKEK